MGNRSEGSKDSSRKTGQIGIYYKSQDDDDADFNYDLAVGMEMWRDIKRYYRTPDRSYTYLLHYFQNCTFSSAYVVYRVC